MIDLSQINIGIVIAVITALSSAISIITNKLFENYQEAKRHKRIISEKLIDTKLTACQNAIVFYGNFLHNLYQSKYIYENFDSSHYSQLLIESQKISEELAKQKLISDNKHFHILLFYEIYGIEDEKIANELGNSIRNHYDYVMSNQNSENFSSKEMKLRLDALETIYKAIDYLRNRISLVRNDLKYLEK